MTQSATVHTTANRARTAASSTAQAATRRTRRTSATPGAGSTSSKSRARGTTPDRRRPDSLGTVESLPSGRFRAYYRFDGERFNAPQTFATREAAKAWLMTERADRVRGTWRDPRQGRTSLAEYARDWLDSRTNLAASTRALYARHLDRWLLPKIGPVELGALDLAQLTPAVVRRWHSAVAEAARESAQSRGHKRAEGHPARVWARSRGLEVADTGRISPQLLAEWTTAGSPEVARPGHDGRTQAAQAYRLLRVICNSAVDDGILETSPCRIKGAGTVRHAERSTASPEEVQQLAAHMPARYRTAVLVAAWSGLRQGELFALRRRDVDLTEGSLRVERSRAGLTKTKGSVRTVYLPRFVRDSLARHLDKFTDRHPDALVFATENSSAPSPANLSSMFARARTRIGRPELTWHDLRHTSATLAYQAGGNVRDVMKRLGHTTNRAAMLYAHAADDSDRLLADRLNDTYSALYATHADSEAHR